MISRRNIRVKVMQTLYTLAAMDPGDVRKSEQQHGADVLNDRLDRSLDLFTIVILYVTRTAQYAELDAHLKASKYLPSAEDMAINTRIAGNTFLWKILENNTFTGKVKQDKLERFVDEDWIKKLYQNLVATDEYQAYIAKQDRVPKEEKAMMQFIWQKLILENEKLQEHFLDELPGWEDDAEMIKMLMENFFRNGEKANFLSLLSGEKKDYALELLQTTLEKEDFCMELIRPKLVNWDPERVAQIDLILLRMGVCELLFFPTIPTKVTINEYIEVAKLYSTPQSGQFVNGVLDNTLKDLEKEHKIRKQERTRKP